VTGQAAADGSGRPLIRLDKWLWQARFFRARRLAAEIVAAGRVRVNGVAVSRPGRLVGPGDVLTFAQAGAIRVVQVRACGARRGPAEEARQLYQPLAGDMGERAGSAPPGRAGPAGEGPAGKEAPPLE
jgi:ribosome-associated heat shock protein Hsp15